jgi:hypothetical protein
MVSCENGKRGMSCQSCVCIIRCRVRCCIAYRKHLVNCRTANHRNNNVREEHRLRVQCHKRKVRCLPHAVIDGADRVGAHDAGKLPVGLVKQALARGANDDWGRRLRGRLVAEVGPLLALERGHARVRGGPSVKVSVQTMRAGMVSTLLEVSA